MSAKSVLATGAVMALALSLAACGGGSGAGSSGSATHLTWLDEMTAEPANGAINALIKQYEKEHPGVTITRTSVPQGQEQTKLTQDVASGSAPAVVFVDSPTTQQHAAQGLVADLSPMVKGWATQTQYYPGAWQSTQYKGGTYSIPLYSDAPGIYANQDMLDAAGIKDLPTTWTQLADDAKKLTKDGVNGLCYGTSPGAAADYLFMPEVWQTGGDINTIDQSALPSLQFFKSMQDAGSSPKDVLTWTWSDSWTAFTNKTCAIVYNGPWQAGAAAKLPFKVTSGILPQKDGGTPASVLGGYNVAIGKGANTTAAWKLIDWLTSKEHLGKFLEDTQQLPNRKDLSDLDFIQQSPYLPTFLKSIAMGKPRTFGPNMPKIDDQLMAMYQSVLAGKSTPEEAAAEGQKQIAPLLVTK